MINDKSIERSLGLNQLKQLDEENLSDKLAINVSASDHISSEISEKIKEILPPSDSFDSSKKNLELIEVANTWQGEGPQTGRQMLIVRFKHCNRKCEFCDTWIKMKTSVAGSYSIDDINNALKKTKALMITGGEPTLQTENINNLENTCRMIQYCDYQLVNVETNGYAIDALIMEINKMVTSSSSKINIIYSPKIFTENDYKVEINKIYSVISNPMVYVKIVADKNKWCEKFIREIGNHHDRNKIYLMPLGVTVDEIASNWTYCVDLADELNLNISTRMHIVNNFV